MEDLVSATCASLRPLLDREYGLFGHSLGGRIAFGIAERLRSEGLPRPRLLAVSGCLPPDRRPRRDVSTMSEAEFLAYLYELGGTPPEAIDNAELMALLSKSLRADFMLAQQLVPVSGRLDCPLLVLGGNADHEVTYDDLQHWRNVSTGPFRLELFPGHHFFIHTMRKTVVDLLLDHIARCASATVNGRGELT
jgi:medium-chain acyl-[acyl-carrier-protein] hydrolase